MVKICNFILQSRLQQVHFLCKDKYHTTYCSGLTRFLKHVCSKRQQLKRVIQSAKRANIPSSQHTVNNCPKLWNTTTLHRRWWGGAPWIGHCILSMVAMADPGDVADVSGAATAFVTFIFNVLASDFNGSTSRSTRELRGRARFFIRRCF